VLLAVATSAHPDEVESILGKKGLGIRDLFSHLITGDQVSRSKPDPEIYETLTDRTGIPPHLTLVFEDSGPGITASTAAGLPCIAVPNDYTRGQDFSTALCVVTDLTPEAKVLKRRGS
jgi:beta-phosphoglucomutase-like phosphatase (HAD superfamily)